MAKVLRYIGESIVDSRQLAKVMRVYWRKYSGLSPIGESHEGILAKVQWTFANGESLIGEILIGEIRVSPRDMHIPDQSQAKT